MKAAPENIPIPKGIVAAIDARDAVIAQIDRLTALINLGPLYVSKTQADEHVIVRSLWLL